MKRFFQITLIIVFSVFFEVSSFASNSCDSTITLLFVGDVMGHGSQIRCATQTNGTYSYSRTLHEMEEIFSLADFTIANLEVPLAGEPYAGYPSFSSPDELAIDLKAAGVDAIVTTNNHAMDKGVAGLIRTTKTLKSLGIPYSGTQASEAEREQNTPIILEHNGIRIGLLSYTSSINGKPKISKYLVNMADTVQIRADYNKALQKGVDEIVVFMHWGEEYERTENIYQQQLATWMHQLGIRIVVGSHPHVIQPMYFTADTDSTYGQVTIYSLGNFVSNQRWRYSDGGMLAIIKIDKKKGKTRIANAGCFPIWVDAPITNSVKDFRIFPVYKAEALAYKFRDGNHDFDVFAKDTREMLDNKCKGFAEIRYDVFLRQWQLPWQCIYQRIKPISVEKFWNGSAEPTTLPSKIGQ